MKHEWIDPWLAAGSISRAQRRHGWLTGWGLLVLSLCTGAWALTQADVAKRWFADVLDAPAVMTPRAPRLETVGLAQAGSAWVAVGARGVILRSEDGGSGWHQMASPVSSDLVSVYFLDAQKGWAVGHDATILHSSDGGATWHVQLDGRSAAKVLRASYAALSQAGDPYAAGAQSELERMFSVSGEKSIVSMPLLDVWFADEREGYAVGAFNMLFRTTDGGKNWSAMDHLTDNPKGFHLNAIRGGPAGVVIVSESGLVLRWQADVGRFVALQTSYKGSFFGVSNELDHLLVYGLRGNARLSRDAGKTWSDIKLDSISNIVRVLPLSDSRWLYVLQDGKLFLQDAQGRAEALHVPAPRAGEVYGAALIDGQKLLTTGLIGPVLTALPGLPQ